jgi:tetratricopeptide (TPR) repeat protein
MKTAHARSYSFLVTASLLIPIVAATASPVAPGAGAGADADLFRSMKEAEEHLDRGEKSLMALDADAAIREFQASLAQDQALKEWADNGLGWAYALRGEYTQAADWMEAARHSFAFCANCAYRGRVMEEATETVWRAAALPREQAERKLRRIVGKKETVLQRPTTHAWDDLSRKRASKDACLVLGTWLLKEGKSRDAEPLLKKAAAPLKDETLNSYRIRIAESYLEQIRSANGQPLSAHALPGSRRRSAAGEDRGLFGRDLPLVLHRTAPPGEGAVRPRAGAGGPGGLASL